MVLREDNPTAAIADADVISFADASDSDNDKNTSAVLLSGYSDAITATLGIKTLTNCLGLPLTTGVTGTLPVANGGTGVTSSTGTVAVVLSNSPTLVTPELGTPDGGILTSCTGLPLTTGVTGILPDANMPNLTGDVTTSEGAVATTIAAKAVDVAMLADGTDGELITWDSSGVATTVPVGTAAQVLTSNGAGAEPTFQAAGGGGSDGWTVVSKPADETVTSSTTLQDDDDLQFAVDANSTYSVIFVLFAVSNSTADIKYGFSFPTGTVGEKTIGAWGNSTVGQSTDALTVSRNIAVGTKISWSFPVKVDVAGTSGTFALQWAQQTSDAVNTIMNKGSMMMYRKAA